MGTLTQRNPSGGSRRLSPESKQDAVKGHALGPGRAKELGGSERKSTEFRGEIAKDEGSRE